MSDRYIDPSHQNSTGGTEKLTEVLKDLHSVCTEIQLSMIATQDGLTMTSYGSVFDPDAVGAMCSELQMICHKTAKQLQQGVLEQVLLKCSDSYMLVMTAGDSAILAVMTTPDSNLGITFIEAERAAKAIKLLLE